MNNLPRELVDRCQEIADHFYRQHIERSRDFFRVGRQTVDRVRNTPEWRTAIEQRESELGKSLSFEWWHHICRDPFGKTYWDVVSGEVRPILREYFVSDYIRQGSSQQAAHGAADIRLNLPQADEWIEKLLRKPMLPVG